MNDWQQRCIECGSTDLRKTFDGLTVVCGACDEEFPAIVGADDHPPTASVKLHGPPGTGKTTQLVRRIEELLRDGKSIADMCVVTYRKEMARDILAKLYERDLIDRETYRKPWAGSARNIGTLHAICNRLVDIDPPDGLHAEKSRFCAEEWGVQFSRSSDESEPTPGELMFGARSWLIENLVPWEEWDKAPQYDQILEVWPHHPEMADFHYKWEDWKAQAGISDFDDMLKTVHEEEIAPRVSVVAADEYHDFTPLQAEIVEQWRNAPGVDVEIVDGDPLQVVYSYAGADAKYYEGVELSEVLLPRSFRVPSDVWEYATRALSPEHDAPPIEPRKESGEVLELDSVELDSSGAKNDNAHSPADFVDRFGEDTMFLTRTRAQARDVAKSLRDAGVVMYGQEGTGAWNHAPKRLALFNVLKALEGAGYPESNHAGQQGLATYNDSTKTSPESIRLDTDELANFLDRVPSAYFDGSKKDAIPRVTGSSKTVTAAELADVVEPEFWTTFTGGADSVGELLKYDGRDTVARALRRYDEPIDSRDLQSGVNVLTIHASKGQEAEAVVLYDGITRRVSTSMSRRKSERENEARLWYVGCTRAKKRLVVARGGWSWTYEYLPDVPPSLVSTKGVVAGD